jgi:heme/copper-type cytochrome/quinol oxidase subunit 2
MRGIPLIGVGAALLASGCTSNHAALNPAGPRARHIADLMLLFVGVSTFVYLVVIAFLVWAMLRKRAAASTQGVEAAQAAQTARSSM